MKIKHTHLIRQCMQGNRVRYGGAIFAMTAAVGISFLTPLVLAETIDGVIGQKRPLNLPGALGAWVDAMGGREFLVQNLWVMALMLVALNLLGGLFQYLRGRWTAQASESIAKYLRDRLYDHLQRLPYNYHVRAETGDLIQRCTSDVETIRRFLSGQLVEAFRTFLMIGVASVVMFRMNAQLTLISMTLMPPLFILALFFFGWVRKFFAAADAAEGRMSAILQENLAGVRVVRAFGRQQYEVEKFQEANESLYQKGRRLSDLMAIFWPAGDLISMLQTGITLIFGVFIAAQGNLLVGEMTVFVSYVSMLLWPVRQLGRILSDLGKAIVAVGRISHVLDEPAEENLIRQAPPLNQDIVFDHVGFEYEEKNPVLVDVSFTAKAGETIAILGATGTGKSTMMHLIDRLYEVKRGAITIGGVDIRDIDKEYLRGRVGLILQEPFLYSRSVRENVAFAGANPTDDQVYGAARTACADDFIREFDKGYETVVGERGVTLSGGQKQRVTIARTLMKDSDILIFDDSLSAVDTETDASIRAALKRREGRATTFIISHRLTTLSAADQILVLMNGRIAQQGTHEQLIEQDGLYRRVYRIQSALEEELEEVK